MPTRSNTRSTRKPAALFVDRFMGTAMHYPCNYGYIPRTISDDGDPVDVLVVTPFPLLPRGGALPPDRRAEDDRRGRRRRQAAGGAGGQGAAALAQALARSRKTSRPSALAQIRHFFEHYKDLEKGKWVKVDGWGGPKDAAAEIMAGVASYKKAKKKPNMSGPRPSRCGECSFNSST